MSSSICRVSEWLPVYFYLFFMHGAFLSFSLKGYTGSGVCYCSKLHSSTFATPLQLFFTFAFTDFLLIIYVPMLPGWFYISNISHSVDFIFIYSFSLRYYRTDITWSLLWGALWRWWWWWLCSKITLEGGLDVIYFPNWIKECEYSYLQMLWCHFISPLNSFMRSYFFICNLSFQMKLWNVANTHRAC